MADKTDGSVRLFQSQEEVAAVLKVAKVHVWQFHFGLAGKPNASPYTTELLRVDPAGKRLVFGPEVNVLSGAKQDLLRFRAESGGMKISFDTRIVPESDKPNTQFYVNYCKVEFPTALHFEQMRKAVRVNFTNLADIPITLFSGDSEHFSGSVEDISETGVKARFSGYLVEKFTAGELVADCELRLPDRSRVQGKVQVLGTLYDFQEDVSYVRCCFKRLGENGALKVRQLIASALESTGNDKTTKNAV